MSELVEGLADVLARPCSLIAPFPLPHHHPRLAPEGIEERGGLLAGDAVAAVGELADQLAVHVAGRLGAAQPVLPEHLLAEEVLDRVGVQGEGLVEGVDGLVKVAGSGVELGELAQGVTATLRTCSWSSASHR